MSYDLVRILSCLKTIDSNVASEVARILGVAEPEDAAVNITEQEVASLLALLRTSGKSLSILIKNGANELWTSYLLCQVLPEHRAGLLTILSNGTPKDTLLYFRKLYGEGQPIISDDDYDVLESLYIEAYPELKDIHETTYDSDDLSESDVVQELSIPETQDTGVTIAESINYDALTEAEKESLSKDKSTSIRPVLTPQEAFDFWCNAPLVPVHFSAKVDGINTKSCLDDKDVKIALSRARAKNAESLDYTLGIHYALTNRHVDFSAGINNVFGEGSVSPEGIAALNLKYAGREYKTSKSTAMAMLRAPSQFDAEDYQWLHLFAFGCDELPVEDAFDKLAKAGYETPYAITVPGENIPRTTVDEFNSWLEDNIFTPIKSYCDENNIQTDGVVMYLTTPLHTERRDVYSDDNIALKFGPWKASDYQGRIVAIVLEQRRIEISVVLEIEPVVTKDMNTATRVGGISLAQLVKLQLKPGDLISFTRKSEAYNVFNGKIEE